MPKRLAKALLPHDAVTVSRMGWLGKRNGQLLALMQREKFSALITIDKNLHYQQNLKDSGISLLLLSAGGNRYQHLLPLMSQVHLRLRDLEPGKIYIIK